MSRALPVNRFTTTAQGLVPAPGTASGLFLRDDATWAAGGGGGGNISPDSHPASANAADDEFEAASVGTKWAFGNAGTSQASQANGSLIFAAQADGAAHGFWQAFAVAGAFEVRAKVSMYNPASSAGDSGGVAILGSSGKFVYIGPSPTASNQVQVFQWNSYSSLSAVAATASTAFQTQAIAYPTYYSIVSDGTTVKFGLSGSGVSGTFIYLSGASVNIVAFLTAVASIGFAMSTNSNPGSSIVCDWIRRIS